MAGFPADKNALDARMADTVIRIRDGFAAAVALKVKLDARSVADLQALGYSAEEANQIKSAFTDLAAGSAVINGQATVPAANNFLFWADKLTGWQ